MHNKIVMNTQHLARSLREHVTKMEYDKRMVRRGIPYIHLPTVPRRSLSLVICEMIVLPIVNELCRDTGQIITFQYGTSTGFFYLMLKSRKFAILYIPNPASGQIYIKFLNEKGAQCMPSRLLNDTDQITDYLKSLID